MKLRILLASILLLGALALWRLASAPVSINFATPYLNEMLSRNEEGWSVRAGQTVLAWRGVSKPLDLNLRDVEIRNRRGQSVVKLQAVSVGLSLSALLRGKVAARRIEILHAVLRVDREETGQMQMQGGTTSGEQDVTGFVLGLVESLLRPHDLENPLSFLDVVRVEADRITWMDRKGRLVLNAAPATFDARRSDSGLRCEMTLQLEAGKSTTPAGPRLEITVDVLRSGNESATPNPQLIDLEGMDFAVSVAARVQHVQAADLGRYWPAEVAGEARAWVTENVRSGSVHEAMLSLALDRGGGQTHLKTLEGSLTYAGLQVDYLDDWPAAESVTGAGTFDRRGLSFNVESGVVGDLHLGPSTVVISGLDSDNERIEIHAPVTGPSNAIADLVARHSPDLSELLALDPTSGPEEGTADLKIGFPLSDRLEFADVILKAKADLPGLQIHNPYVLGIVPTMVDFEAEQGGKASVGVATDLSEARVLLPLLGWQKERGRSGKVSAVVDLADLEPSGVRELKIDAGTLRAQGHLSFQDEGRRWKRLELEDVSIGRTTLSQVTVKESADQLQVKLGRGVVDLEPIRHGSEEERKSPEAEGDSRKLVLIAPQLQRVWLAKDRYLEGVSVHAEHQNGGWRNVEVSGKTPGKDPGAFEVGLKPEAGQRQRLAVHAENGGSLFRILGVTSEVRGGKLDVSGETSGRGATLLHAHVEMRDYAVLRASLLTRLLTLASGRGFGRLAIDDAIDFDYLGGDITFAGGRVTTERIRTHGPAMGITIQGWVDVDEGKMDLEGVIVPAYTANRILGKIPVLGGLLSGNGKEGFLAIQYQVTGALAHPEMDVDTLKSLTPAFLREIFGVLDAARDR